MLINLCVKKCKKTFDNSTISKIFILLDKGYYPAQIAKILKVSRQRVHYHIKKAVRKGILKRVNTGGCVSFYRLSGNNPYKKGFTWGEGFCRLHSFGLKFKILRDGKRIFHYIS